MADTVVGLPGAFSFDFNNDFAVQESLEVLLTLGTPTAAILNDDIIVEVGIGEFNYDFDHSFHIDGAPSAGLTLGTPLVLIDTYVAGAVLTGTFTAGSTFVGIGVEAAAPTQTLTATVGTATAGTGVLVQAGILTLTGTIGAARYRVRPHTWIAAQNARSIEEVFVILITITHDDLEEPIYLANDNVDELESGVRGVISQGHEFIYLPFQFILPSLEKDSIPKAKITMDNISREIVNAISAISDPPDIRVQIALSTDPDIIEYDLQGFKIAAVTYDAMTISGDLTVEQFFNEPYPSVRFTPSRFPGLFRGRSSEIGISP